MLKRSNGANGTKSYKELGGTQLHKLITEQNTDFNTLSANFTKWSNTFKQFVGKLAVNCLNVFDHFVRLALKGLIKNYNTKQITELNIKEKFSSKMASSIRDYTIVRIVQVTHHQGNVSVSYSASRGIQCSCMSLISGSWTLFKSPGLLDKFDLEITYKFKGINY